MILLCAWRSASMYAPAIVTRSPVRGAVVCEAHALHAPKEGLIKHAEDKDACGVGFVGELSKQPSRKCITDALGMLVRMTHRGACGCEENTGASGSLTGRSARLRSPLHQHWHTTLRRQAYYRDL